MSSSPPRSQPANNSPPRRFVHMTQRVETRSNNPTSERPYSAASERSYNVASERPYNTDSKRSHNVTSGRSDNLPLERSYDADSKRSANVGSGRSDNLPLERSYHTDSKRSANVGSGRSDNLPLERPYDADSKRSDNIGSERSNSNKPHRPMVFVIYYSMYGHVAKLASSIVAGIERAGCRCRVFQVAETLSDEILTKMHAPPKNRDIPIIRPDQLPEADGFLFGMPTRFGTAPTQIKTLFDACGGHWLSDALIGKPAGVFFSTSTLGGGQETTALSCVPFFTHLGMVFVPLGYRNKSLMNLDQVHGGSPYGAGTLAGTQGERQPSELELQLAQTQGVEFAKLVLKLNSTTTHP